MTKAVGLALAAQLFRTVSAFHDRDAHNQRTCYGDSDGLSALRNITKARASRLEAT